VSAINYTPPPTVKRFIRDYRPGEFFQSFIIGPVGSGKTTGNFFKLAYLSSLQKKSARDGLRHVRAVIVRNTHPQLRDTTIPSWNYWFKDGEAGQWKATDSKFILRFGDVHCEVLFRALDTPDDVNRVLSLEVTFAILDEFVQIPKEVVEALSARCGRYPPEIDGGATNWGMWGVSNPGNEDDWWYEMLENADKRPTNLFYYKQPSGFSDEAENTENLPGKRAYYTSLADGKSEAWVKQFIEVEWGYSLTGTPVVHSFKPKIHIAEKPLKFDPHLPLVAGLDPGVGGSALIFGQLSLDGRLFVLDELCQRGYGAARLADERLRPLLRSRFAGAEFVISPDPASLSRTPTDERSVVDVLRGHPYKFRVEVPDQNNRLATRLEAIEHFTTRLAAPGPALVIDPRCRMLIRALRSGWKYGIVRQVGGGSRTAVEPEKNEYSHPGDAFGYLCKYFFQTEARAAKRRAHPLVIPTFTNSYAVR
jgi:hypothetical protein